MKLGDYKIVSGKSLPLGATVTGEGVNFAIFSRFASSMKLVIFESAEDKSPYIEIPIDKMGYKTGDIWHCLVKGLKAGACYLYRAEGPFMPERGQRFDNKKSLLDPYAKALTSLENWDLVKCNESKMPRCIVVNDNDFDCQGDRPLNYPLRFSILYETHVKGFTANTNSGVKHPGTYRGVIEKIPYLKELGVTSLELLPIQEFCENEYFRTNPHSGEVLKNYWGYSTVAFFAPKESYAADRSPGGQVNEFKLMVRELHKAGIEVILDIVFNHTAEGDQRGPTFSFRA